MAYESNRSPSRGAGRFVGLRLDRGEPELLDGANIELPSTISERAEHCAAVVFADHHAFSEIVREAWIASNKEPVYHATVVRDDIADIHTKRGIRGIAVFREQHEV